MWLMTTHGFYSVACGWNGSPSNPDPNIIMIRAHTKGHLENLINNFSGFLSDSDKVIHISDDTDYRYRMILHKAVAVEIIGKMLREIDYCNFKKEAEKGTKGKEDTAYMWFLHRVWEHGYSMQAEEDIEC